MDTKKNKNVLLETIEENENEDEERKTKEIRGKLRRIVALY